MRQSAIRLFAFALVLAIAPVVRAAEDEPVPEKPVEAEEPAPQPEPEVEPVRGIRYRVWLTSGRSLEGVVRAKGVFEVLTYDEGYRPADEDEKGAGVRFWFPKAQDGFIFVALSNIERLEELGELSTDEGRSIARARVASAQRAERERFEIKAREAAEKAAAEAAARGEETPAAGDAAETEGAEETPAPQADGGKMAALLLKFPPTRWTLDSPDEIERRKVVLGLFPSDEEKEFLAVFDEWKVAYEAWAEATESEENADEEPAEDGERSARVTTEG